MKYFDKQNNQITCPYGLSFLDQYIESEESALVMTLEEYHSNQVDISKFDKVFLYEWSGWSTIPNNLPNNVIVLYFDYTFSNTNSNNFYYPHWLFFTSNLASNNNISADYLFSCASRNFNNGRPGKIYNYQKLKKKFYWDRILYTKFKSIESFELYSLPEINQDSKFKSIVDEFLLDYNTWQVMDTKDLELIESMTLMDLDVYKKSLFHIIAETAIHQTSLSEKTFKVFASGQIPIMCGPHNAINHLRELGFDVFDDIVDHSYDKIIDWQARIDSMHSSLDQLSTVDHNELIMRTETRRIKNQQHLKSENLHKRLLEPIVKQIFR